MQSRNPNDKGFNNMNTLQAEIKASMAELKNKYEGEL